MPYFVLTDVQGWAAGLTTISSSTTPSDTVVTGWVGDYNSVIAAALARGNAVLPLSTDEQAELKMAGAKVVVYDVMAAGKAVARDTKQPALYMDWKQEFKDLMKAIEDGKYAVETDDLPDSATRDADPSDESDDRNPVFTKDYVP